MKVEAMVRRLPVAWPNRRPITRTSTPWARRKPDTVNAVPAQSEPAPLTQWYKDRSMGLGRPLGVVKCEAVWTVHGTHPTKGDKTITVNAKHPREAHAKAKAALKASGHKVTSVKFKEAVIEGGPGSGRHPGFGAKMYDAAAKAVAARQAATAQRRAGYAARAKNIAAKNVAAKKAGDSLMAQHLARMARQTVYGPKVFGYRGAQGFKVESLNEAKKKLKADPKTLGISTFQVGGQTYEAAPSTSYYRSAGKALLQRKLTADEQSDIKKLKGVYKKLKVEGGAGSGNFEHGGRLHKQGFSRVGGGTKVAPDPQAKKDFHLAAAKDKWYHRNE